MKDDWVEWSALPSGIIKSYSDADDKIVVKLDIEKLKIDVMVEQ